MKTALGLRFPLAVAALLCLASAQSTFAAGPITITQAKAAAGNVTAGDAPGFPVSINKSGSYILAGNLTVNSGNTTAIEINASHVTIDLGGFAILGPVDCSGGSCVGAGDGSGIITPNVRFNITIRNGTVQGLGESGILLIGDSHLVEYLHARSNGAEGISIDSSADNAGSIAQFNTVQRNGGFGLYLKTGIARHNVADVNAGSGIVVLKGSVTNNVATRNAFRGLTLGARVAYFDNMLDENGLEQVTGGKNMGRNLCGIAFCP